MTGTPQVDTALSSRFPASFDREYRMIIDGRPVSGSDESAFRCVDPYEDAEWGVIYAADGPVVDTAVAAARRAFDEGPWGRSSAAERARLLRSLADVVDRNADELTKLQIHENGKLVGEMAGGIAGLALHARYVAELVESRRDRIVETGMPRLDSVITSAPVGVVAAITPWNSPLTLLAWKLLPALGAGCTLVIKPSEVTPASTIRLAELCLEAGYPPGVVNVVTGFGTPTAQHLVEHPGVDKIGFTGSTRTGQAVMRTAAATMKRLTLELGGKSPQLILRDADLDQAVHGVMAGVFAATGQTCLAGSRVLVEAPVYDEFVSRLAAATDSLVLGDPLDRSTDVGPMANHRQLDTVLDYLDIGAGEGATVAAGGARAGGTPELDRGLFVRPTVFADVAPTARVAREEIFGPVVTVSQCESADDAVRIANDSPFGLAAGVWTTDAGQAQDVAGRLRAGTVWINTYRVLHYAMPFGGFKLSGYGRELGPDALEPYSEVKSVWTDHGNPQTFGRPAR
jgi:acyl-CoA reductase-like NAD-dependent aldehyde dehydrogenase